MPLRARHHKRTIGACWAERAVKPRCWAWAAYSIDRTLLPVPDTSITCFALRGAVVAGCVIGDLMGCVRVCDCE